jgi:PAS domain S-box-containing protein
MTIFDPTSSKDQKNNYSHIGFVAPYEELAETTRRVCADLGWDIDIQTGDREEGVNIAAGMRDNGVEIIVSRGCTAAAISDALNMPVVEVEVSGFDLLRAINEAKKFGNRIGAIGSHNIIYGSKNIEEILDVQITELIANSESDVPLAIREAVMNKMDVIIGDVVSVRWAKSLDIGAILVTSGKEAIRIALHKAFDLATIRRNEWLRAEQFKTILDYSHEGIVAADRDGNVSVVNPAAEKILGINAITLKGRLINDVLPVLQMEEIIKSGKPSLNRLCRIGGKLIVQNTVPIESRGVVNGVISTFRDAKYYEEVESKVRQKLHMKGHVAQYSFNDIVAESAAMKKILSQAKSYAAVDSTILITGETGTGKELVAQGIHNASGRKNKPFIAINCAAIPVNLLESELFGYVEGAFTGAVKGGKVGLFELAHGGTLFFDEIGEIPLEVQSRLLRVLQQKAVMRVGGDNIIPTDVRIIAATHRDLKSSVEENLFRRDLYYRLNVLRLHIPPLRERPDDIPLLIERICDKLCKGTEKKCVSFPDNILEQFKCNPWEGNVRELENIVERLMILKGGAEVNEADICELLSDTAVSVSGSNGKTPPVELSGTLEDIEKRIICQILDETKDKTLVCRMLGISQTTLWRRLAKWGIS